MSKGKEPFDPTIDSMKGIRYGFCLASGIVDESKLENRKIYLRKVGDSLKYSICVLNNNGSNVIVSGTKSVEAGSIPIDSRKIRDPFSLEMITWEISELLRDTMKEKKHIPDNGIFTPPKRSILIEPPIPTIPIEPPKPIIQIGGYSVCLVTSEIKGTQLENKKIYIRKKQDLLEYGVLDPFNSSPIIDRIASDEFKYPIPEPFSLERLDPLLADLTRVIYGRGHIPIETSEIKITTEPPIGRGRSAILYRGRWKNKDVAVKEIKLNEGEEKYTPDAIAELKQEVAILTKVKSENIVQFQGVYKSPKYCLVMEYMPRGNLYQLLNSNQVIPWEIRYRIALDIAHGLETLHESNIIHGDLKSFNILLSDHLRAKICDFGISRISRNQTVTTVLSLAELGEIKGSIRWMAPELLDSSLSTKRSDMYSFGMVLWEIATRKLPFTHISNDILLIHHIESGGKESISEAVKEEHPQVPQIAELIDKCWHGQYQRPTVQEANTILTGLNKSQPDPDPDPSKPPLLAKKATPSRDKRELQILQVELIIACEEGDLKAVDHALALGANPMDSDEKRNNPLCAAVWGMNIVIVNRLVDMLGDKVLEWKHIEKQNIERYGRVWKISGYLPIPKTYERFRKLLAENGSGMSWDVELTESEIEGLCLEFEEALNRQKAIIQSVITSIKINKGKEVEKTEPPVSSVKNELKVPGDGSCLFWSVALGVLIPVLDQKEEYRLAFNSLFVSDDKDSQLFIAHGEALKEKIKEFVRTNDTALISNPQTIFYQLINWYFRQKVANYIDSHPVEFSDYITGSLIQYVSSLRNVSGWGGEIEIYAIYKMLNEQYRIEVENSDVEPLGSLERPKIQIIYTNVLGRKGGPKNHYNLRMPNLKDKRVIPPLVTPPTPPPRRDVIVDPKPKTPPDLKHTKRIDLPNDPSCLFLAVVISVLAQTLNDDVKYHRTFDRLFASDDRDAELFYRDGANIKARIQAFLAGDEKAIRKQNSGDVLYHLINHYFRLKVANYIDLHFSEFSGFIKGSFTQYIEKLRQETFVGGHIELRAIFRLLGGNYRFFIDKVIDLGAPEQGIVHLIHNAERNHYGLYIPEALIIKSNPIVDMEILNVILDKLIARCVSPVSGGKVVYTAEPSNTLIEEKSSVSIPYAAGDGRIPHFSGGTAEFSRVAFSTAMPPMVLTPEEKKLTETELGGELKRIGFFNIPLGHQVAFSTEGQKIRSENKAVSTRCAGSTWSKRAGSVGICPTGNTNQFQRCVFVPSSSDGKPVYTPSPEEQKLSQVRTLLDRGFFSIPQGHHIVAMRTDPRPAGLTQVTEAIPATVGGNNPHLHIGIIARGNTEAFPRITRR